MKNFKSFLIESNLSRQQSKTLLFLVLNYRYSIPDTLQLHSAIMTNKIYPDLPKVVEAPNGERLSIKKNSVVALANRKLIVYHDNNDTYSLTYEGLVLAKKLAVSDWGWEIGVVNRTLK